MPRAQQEGKAEGSRKKRVATMEHEHRLKDSKSYVDEQSVVAAADRERYLEFVVVFQQLVQPLRDF